MFEKNFLKNIFLTGFLFFLFTSFVAQASTPFILCANFKDVSINHKYCEAITWGREHGIIEGFRDSTFKPDRGISRVETVKVILEAFDITLFTKVSEYLGFPDLVPSEWYMPYMKTAIDFQIVHGFVDGTFKPDRFVSKSEALKIMLETGRIKHALRIPTETEAEKMGSPYKDVDANVWYTKYTWISSQFYLTNNQKYFFPNHYMKRGEMLDMLYRYHLAGLDK